MSIYRQRDSLDWLSLFSFSEQEKEQIVGQIQNNSAQYDRSRLADIFLRTTELSMSDYCRDDSSVQTACERIALKFMLVDTDFAKNLLDGEEFEKAQQTYGRKQYNSKVLQKLLAYFQTSLAHLQTNKLHNLFTLSFLDELRIVREEETDRSYGDLKKVIEKAAGGVKSGCYSKAESCLSNAIMLSDSLNQVAVDDYGYDFNQCCTQRCRSGMSTLFCNREEEINNSILQLALLDNAEFWKQHPKFVVAAFVNEVAEQNDEKHAKKVLRYLFDQLRNKPDMEPIIHNRFPLWASRYDEMLRSLEEQAHRFAFKRISQYCDISELDKVPLCYPMSSADQKWLEIGRGVWNRFIDSYSYPADHEKVSRYLDHEISRFLSGETHQEDDIAVILDAAPFRYSAENMDRRMFSAYCPDCFSFENIWSRVYLKAYAVTLLSQDEQKQFACLQRIFVDLFKTVEERMGICTAHQLDESARNRSFEGLKKNLQSFDVPVSDAHKEEYVISLLDRDTARMAEAEVFPMLEQLGDAIYGFAVAEMLFYQPKTVKMGERFEHFTRAEAQVKISVKNGFDQLYLYSGFPAKYVEYDTLHTNMEKYALDKENEQAANKEKYLADSLEMVLGAICRDSDVFSAIRFAKALLRKTFPKDFSAEIHPTEENIHNAEIGHDYWSRILAAPYTEMNDSLSALWRALDKLLLCVSIGTDTKEKRDMITYSHGNTAVYGESESYRVSFILHEYLLNGLSYTVNKYGDILRTNYHNKKI